MSETSRGRKTEQEILAEQAAIWAVVPEGDKAVCKALYPSLPEECEGMDSNEFYAGIAEALVAFREDEKREPSAGAELDAWLNSAHEFAAYVKAHPVQTSAPSAPVNPAPAEPQPTAEPTAEQLEALASKLRKEYTKSFRQGEREYRKGLLDAGRLIHEYVICQVKRGQARAQAVKTVEGDLNAIATTTVNANELIRCHAAFSLLCAAQGLEKDSADMPYGAYRLGWSRLIQAEDQGKASERYILLPGMEKDCLSLYADGVKGGWNTDSSRDQCGGLLKRWADATATAKIAAEAKAKADSAKTAQEAESARLDKEAAERVTKDAEQRLAETAALQKVATDKAEQDRLEAQRVQHEKELEQRRKDQADAQSKADALAREKADSEKRSQQAEKERLAAEREKERQDRKAEDKGKGKDKPLTVSGADCRQGEPLLVTLAKTAKSASSKDFGETLARAIISADDWMQALHDTVASLAGILDANKKGDSADGILDAVLMALDGHKGLAKKTQRAVKAALIILSKKEEPAPIAQPSANGLLVVAGS